jgi:hypothetical protein
VARTLIKPLLVRFFAGLVGSVGLGWIVFRGALFDPTEIAFQCVTVGILTAGMLAVVRLSRHDLAALLIVVFGMGRFGLAGTEGWTFAVSGFLLAAGVYLAAVIFDLLAREGMAFGKFVILAALLGGINVALLPLVQFHTLTSNDVIRAVLIQLLLGLIIGDGAGFGVEMAELPAAVAERARRPGMRAETNGRRYDGQESTEHDS